MQAQGTLLFDTTAEAIHPLGTPYPAFYEYMSCMGVNPCWGWLNTNASWRNATQARADQLNQVGPTLSFASNCVVIQL